MKKNLSIIAVIIIIIGIIVMAAKGLVFDLNYAENEQIQIKIGSNFEIKDIRQIAQEVFYSQKILVNKVGESEDSVSIKVKDYTEEQLIQLNDKINEKYSITNTIEDIERYHNSNVRGRDIIKHFGTSMIIATLFILVYAMIRYRKLGAIHVGCEIISKLFLAQIFILSIYSIARLPISRITMSISIVVYLVMLVFLIYEKEEQLKEKTQEVK